MTSHLLARHVVKTNSQRLLRDFTAKTLRVYAIQEQYTRDYFPIDMAPYPKIYIIFRSVVLPALTFWRRIFFHILAHPLFKMCVLQKPNNVAL